VRLEGWHVVVFLAMLVMVAIVAVAVTLIIRWTLRRARRKDTGG
jgi:hypothetical protein